MDLPLISTVQPTLSVGGSCSDVSPVVRDLAGRTGLIPVPCPTEDDPGRFVQVPFVLVPAGLEVKILSPQEGERLISGQF